MIIFDLDGSLADCEHRRHFVDPLHPKNIDNAEMLSYTAFTGDLVKAVGWHPDWRSFYEACSEDKPILPTCSLFQLLHRRAPCDVQIWSGRCESVSEKTCAWIDDFLVDYKRVAIRMRPIGDRRPDDELKEKWLDQVLSSGQTIDFVIDDRPKVVRMWRRRGIFVFDVNQSGEEF